MISTENATKERSLLEGFVHYVGVLKSYRWLIIISTAAATIAALLFVIISLVLPPEKSPLPNEYSAQANILIEPANSESSLASTILGSMGFTQGANRAPFDNGDLVLEVLNSRTIQDKIISEFSLVERYRITKSVKGFSRSALRSKISYDYARNTGSLKISFTDIDPKFARDVVNRMVELLDEWFSVSHNVAQQKERMLLEEKLAEVKKEIDNLQTRLKSLQTRTGVLNIEELGASQSATLSSLRTQLLEKDREIKDYSSFSNIDDPHLAQLKSERQTILDLMNQNQSVYPNSAGQGGATYADVAQEFSQLTLELDMKKEIYNRLLPQYETAKIAPESMSIFQVLELAEIPDMKSGPQRSKLLIMALFGSLVGSAVLALGLNAVRGIKKNIVMSRLKGSR